MLQGYFSADNENHHHLSALQVGRLHQQMEEHEKMKQEMALEYKQQLGKLHEEVGAGCVPCAGCALPGRWRWRESVSALSRTLPGGVFDVTQNKDSEMYFLKEIELFFV